MAKYRRNHGEGTIILRADRPLPYQAQISVNGKRMSRCYKTKEEAVKWLRQMTTMIDDNIDIDRAHKNFKDAIDGWVTSQKMSWRPKTYQQNQHVVQRHLIPHIPRNWKVNAVKPAHIRKILSDIAESGIGNRTQRYARTMLYGFFESLCIEHVLLVNPVKSVKVGRTTKKEMQYLSRREAKRLIEMARGRTYEHLWYLAIHTGMREGELLGLRWGDVDFDHACIIVQNQTQWLYTKENKGKIHFEFSQPKTDKSRRRIPLGPAALDHLQRQKQRVELQKILRKDWDDHDLVFPNLRGRPIESTNITRALRKDLKKANVKIIRFHDLRHTCATLLLLANVNPKIVSERLGHSSVQITLDTYSHVIPGLQDKAAHEMDKMFGSEQAENPDPEKDDNDSLDEWDDVETI